MIKYWVFVGHLIAKVMIVAAVKKTKPGIFQIIEDGKGFRGCFLGVERVKGL